MHSVELLEREDAACRPPEPPGFEAEARPEQRPGQQLGAMLGRSMAMQRLFRQMQLTAAHFRLAWMEGEAGTGKALAARTLHDLCNSSAPFVRLTAQKFLEEPEEWLREAQGGTLYLIQVEESSPAEQAALLDLLQSMEHRRGRSGTGMTSPRVIVALCSPLRTLGSGSEVIAGRAQRITAIRFALPPLRGRKEDVPLLAQRFMEEFGSRYGKALRGLGPGTLQRLQSYGWPGNVRELESVITAAAFDCEGQWIRPIDIRALRAVAAVEGPAPQLESAEDPNLDRAIRRHIARVLTEVNGNKLRAARLLGISRSTLYRLLEAECRGAR